MLLLPMEQQPDEPTMMAIQAGLVPNASIDPNTGQAVVLRLPNTITERLQAQASLGLGMSVGPAGASAGAGGGGGASAGGGGGSSGGPGGARPAAGRKATAQAPPSLERKPVPGGGERVTIAESRRG